MSNWLEDPCLRRTGPLSKVCSLTPGYHGRKRKGDWSCLRSWLVPTEIWDPSSTLGWYYPGGAGHSLTCG